MTEQMYQKRIGFKSDHVLCGEKLIPGIRTRGALQYSEAMPEPFQVNVLKLLLTCFKRLR